MAVSSYLLWENAVPDWLCDKIVLDSDWSQEVKATIGINKTFIEEARKSKILWEGVYSPIGCIIQTYMQMANSNAGWNFDIASWQGVQIGKYEEGGYYTWHKDGTPEDGLRIEKVRKISASVLLNDSFTGGELEFKNQKQQPILKKGSIIVFPSFLEHRVSSVISGTRYSAVMWVEGPSFK